MRLPGNGAVSRLRRRHHHLLIRVAFRDEPRVQEDIQRNQAQVKVLLDEIERHHQEIIATRTKYEALKKRYQALREEQASGADTTAAQTPTRK